MERLQDSFGRKFPYLRLSITDACNFKCVYCLPNGYKRPPSSEDYLSIHEISNLIRAFAEMGTHKVRLTGGEPTLRRDFLEIARGIREIPGIQSVALSTNGYRIKKLASELRPAGITSLNVSIDSLDPKCFAEITGVDQLNSILEGIDAALDHGFSEVKVNAVLLKGWNEEDFYSFVGFVKNKPIVIRFIELMPTGQNQALFAKYHVQGSQVREKLISSGWVAKPRKEWDGPAQEFIHPEFLGRMGIIAPYSKDFCSTCNRLRITSRGGLRLCLFGEGSYSIREFLQSPDQKEALKMRVLELLQKKEISHYLPEARYGNNQTFSSMGG
jgi:GTP 3',8-cyclase